LKRLLTPTSNSSVGGSSAQGSASTKTRGKPFGSADYGKWQLSRNQNNASKQIINDGAT